MSRKYAILGETLKHTMSPPIHARLFELKGREFEYEILEVKPEELKDKAEYLNSLNGYNITIPHKIGIIDYTDELDQSAKRYHSVNCVDNKNGRHVGYNTDCDGFLRTVRAMNIDFTGKMLLLPSPPDSKAPSPCRPEPIRTSPGSTVLWRRTSRTWKKSSLPLMLILPESGCAMNSSTGWELNAAGW